MQRKRCNWPMSKPITVLLWSTTVNSILLMQLLFSRVWPLWPHGLSWDFPKKNTGAGYCFLFQAIFPTQELNLGLLHWQAVFYSSATREAWNLCIQSILKIWLNLHPPTPFSSCHSTIRDSDRISSFKNISRVYFLNKSSILSFVSYMFYQYLKYLLLESCSIVSRKKEVYKWIPKLS